jgi:cation-dependent mannose-6-phosphate receptor
VHQETQALSPGGVFGVMALIAVLVYFVGGCVYQRTVMHQRGWRQLPNYAMWAGIWRFFSVCLPSRCHHG